MSESIGKGRVEITGGDEHRDIRAALVAIRAVVADRRDRLRVEHELLVALVRAGRLQVLTDEPPRPGQRPDEDRNRLWRHAEPGPRLPPID